MLMVNDNSYVDVSYADSYMDSKLFNEEWTNLTSKQKEQALIEATSEIDMLYLRGVKATKSQKLQFPRAYPTYMPNCNYGMSNDYIGYWYIESAVQYEIKRAVCEEALAIVRYGNSARTNLQKQGVKSARFGDMQEVYDNRKRLFSSEATALMKKYMLGTAPIMGETQIWRGDTY